MSRAMRPALGSTLLVVCLLAPMPVGATVCEAIAALKTEDYDAARSLLNEKPTAEQPEAAFLRGKLHEFGLGVPADADWAIREITDAAVAGVVEAQARLALFYETGKVGQNQISKDYEKSLRWSRIAASKGHADAMKNLGVHYEHGLGTDQDTDKAKEWYGRAASKGSLSALRNLGRILLERGEEPVRAILLLKTAARANDGLAHWLLANHYRAKGGDDAKAAAYFHFLMAGQLMGNAHYKQKSRELREELGVDPALAEMNLKQFLSTEPPVYRVDVDNRPWDSIAQAAGCDRPPPR